MSFTNPNTIQRPSQGANIPSEWGDMVNDDLNYLDQEVEGLVNGPSLEIYGIGDQILVDANSAPGNQGAWPDLSTTKAFIQTGTTVPSTNAYGIFAFYFPKPFPNGILSAFYQNGDPNANGNVSVYVYTGGEDTGPGQGLPFGQFDFEPLLNQSYGVVIDNATGYIVPNRLVRVNWLAIGW